MAMPIVTETPAILRLRLDNHGHCTRSFYEPSLVGVGLPTDTSPMFRLALEVASAIPEQCVMIGDSEISDIAPAAALGMQTILVAIEEPFPTASSASAAVGSLDQVIPVLQARLGD